MVIIAGRALPGSPRRASKQPKRNPGGGPGSGGFGPISGAGRADVSSVLLGGLVARLALERVLLLVDDRAFLGHLGVQCREVLPVVGEVVLVEDGLDRALGDARLAVDALL